VTTRCGEPRRSAAAGISGCRRSRGRQSLRCWSVASAPGGKSVFRPIGPRSRSVPAWDARDLRQAARMGGDERTMPRRPGGIGTAADVAPRAQKRDLPERHQIARLGLGVMPGRAVHHRFGRAPEREHAFKIGM